MVVPQDLQSSLFHPTLVPRASGARLRHVATGVALVIAALALAGCGSKSVAAPTHPGTPTAGTAAAKADSYTSQDLHGLLPCTGTALKAPKPAVFGSPRDTGECALAGVHSAINVAEYATYTDSAVLADGIATTTPLGSSDVVVLVGANWVMLVPAAGLADVQAAVGGTPVG